jgi:hypothetical protein
MLQDVRVILAGSNNDERFSLLDTTGFELVVIDSIVFLSIDKPTTYLLNKGQKISKNVGYVPLKKIISQFGIISQE